MSTKNKKIIKRCEICGVSFHPRYKREETQRTCSKDCSYKLPDRFSKNIVAKICEVCGNTFTCVKSRESTAKYCSKECQYNSKERTLKISKGIKNLNKGILVPCKNCNKEKRVSPSRSKNYKFCSMKCKAEYNSKHNNSRVTKICEECSKEFEVKKYRSESARYCSRKCQNNSKDRIKRILETKDEVGSQSVTNVELSTIIKELNKDGYELLSFDYTNQNTPLKVRCNEGHTYTTSWSDIRRNRRCPTCAGRRRTIEDVKEEFKKSEFTVTSTEYTGCYGPIEYICKNGHRNATTWPNYAAGHRCPDCKGVKKKTIEQVKSFTDSIGYSLLTEEYINKTGELEVICDKGHRFTSNWQRLNRGNRCPICNKQASKAEIRLSELVKGMLPSTAIVETNTRDIIYPYEIDIYVPEAKLAIEYCGLYWHSDEYKESSYHRNKLDTCTNNRIRLLTIFEDEFLNKEEIVLSRIKQALNITPNRVYARKTELREITPGEVNIFYKHNHLQGETRGKLHLGLFYKNELIQAASLGSLSRMHTSKNTLELKRLCSKINYSVIGGASKIFKYMKSYADKNNYDKIRSYCDLRYGTGNLYDKLGFEKTSETRYTPHYVKDGTRYRNQALRKTPEERLTGKTEVQLRKEQGYTRIFDCGHQTWDYLV